MDPNEGQDVPERLWRATLMFFKSVPDRRINGHIFIVDELIELRALINLLLVLPIPHQLSKEVLNH